MNVMTYDNFIKWVVKHIKDYLPQKFRDAELKLSKVTKNNGTTLDALSIIKPGDTICPLIYLNDFYKHHKKGWNLEETIRTMAEIRVKFDSPDTRDFPDYEDYEDIKGRIIPRLINTSGNSELLRDHPHTQLADLSVTYYITAKAYGSELYCVQITNALLDSYGVTVEEIHQEAVKNLASITPGSLLTSRQLTIESMVPKLIEKFNGDEGAASRELLKILPDTDMYIITNSQRWCGASSVIDPDFMDYVRETVGQDFYLIPSSVHEFMLAPMIPGNSPEYINSMIREVNRREVSPDEILSDHCYLYDYSRHELCMTSGI